MESVSEENIVAARPEIKLLVVDDREDNLLSIETILEKDGYTIRKADSGTAALKILLREQDFTLILMDIQMPVLTGFETASLIYQRETLQHIPIIFITANDYAEDSIFESYRAGGVDYINKPINPDLLRAKVSIFVELYNKNNDLRRKEQELRDANKELEIEIQERRKSEETVRQLNGQLVENIRQLEVINEELRQFAYVASHDLQEPLRKIIVFGDMLLSRYSGALDADGSSYLQRMIKASNRMQTLIKNLLAFSRLSANTEPFEETNLSTLIETILSDLEIYIQQTGATFHISEMPTLKAIPRQLSRLFQNLIINSLKFRREGTPPEVIISAEKIKGMQISGIDNDKYDDDYYRISVSDNGIGFDPKYSDQIFEIFKRLHSFENIEGTGIGLAICRKIVDQHNGYIAATGKENEGATFTITIPVKQPIPVSAHIAVGP